VQKIPDRYKVYIQEALQDYSNSTKDFIKWKKAIRKEQLDKLVEEPLSQYDYLYSPKSEIKKALSSFERK